MCVCVCARARACVCVYVQTHLSDKIYEELKHSLKVAPCVRFHLALYQITDKQGPEKAG